MKIVSTTATNLLSLYYTMLNVTTEGGIEKIVPSEQGDVSLTADKGKAAICVEPVRKIESSATLTNDVYFVPSLDFKSIKVEESDVAVTEVEADGKSLWKLASGTTLTKISL